MFEDAKVPTLKVVVAIVEIRRSIALVLALSKFRKKRGRDDRYRRCIIGWHSCRQLDR